MRLLFALSILTSVAVEAFHLSIASNQPRGRACYALAQREEGGEMDRRALMRFTAAALGALSITGLGSSSAFAASPVINEIKIRESVKGVKESVEALKLYEDFVTQKDFYGIKKSLRVPPVSDVRKDCRRIIAGLDGKQKSETDTAYNKFIQGLESVDLIATRAIQNDNEIKEEDFKNLGSKYQETQTHLEKFLDVVLETPYALPVNIRIEQP